MTATLFRHVPRQEQYQSAGLTIELGAATGTAPTSLAAFDAALRVLGVGDANLIRLSSVIPPDSAVVRTDRVRKPIGWGDRLYCVYAEQHATKPGQTAAAGIGWVLVDDGSGAGLFVEHEAETEAEVVDLIQASLADMTRHRPGRFTRPAFHTVSTRCLDQPTCALVLAAYQSVPWSCDDSR